MIFAPDHSVLLELSQNAVHMNGTEPKTVREVRLAQWHCEAVSGQQTDHRQSLRQLQKQVCRAFVAGHPPKEQDVFIEGVVIASPAPVDDYTKRRVGKEGDSPCRSREEPDQ